MKIYIAITLYLWVVLALFALYKRALLNENGIDYWRQGYAIVNALILGKVLAYVALALIAMLVLTVAAAEAAIGLAMAGIAGIADAAQEATA